MRRNDGSEFFYTIIIIVFTFLCVIALLNAGLSLIMKSIGFQFTNPDSGYFFSVLIIIIAVLFFIYFSKLKEYALLCMDIIINKKYSEILLKKYLNELQTQTKNYQKLKKGIDEIDKIL